MAYIPRAFYIHLLYAISDMGSINDQKEKACAPPLSKIEINSIISVARSTQQMQCAVHSSWIGALGMFEIYIECSDTFRHPFSVRISDGLHLVAGWCERHISLISFVYPSNWYIVYGTYRPCFILLYIANTHIGVGRHLIIRRTEIPRQNQIVYGRTRSLSLSISVYMTNG